MKKIILLVLVGLSYFVNAQNSGPANKMKPALIIIDIQNEYIPKMSEQEKKYAFQVINGSIWTFRQHNLPIIRVYHSDLNWSPAESSEGFKYPSSVIIKDSDIMVHKHYPSAFTKTDLDKILKEINCNTIYLCGLSATACVLATYFGGVDRGYNTFLIRDGIMSHDPHYTNVINDICNSVSFETMRLILSNIPVN
ncbi:MAG: isochorismatase family protein [Bacteroidetes bacterium]|nr:isochorismatase family protein [Bacteroidota bacterium]